MAPNTASAMPTSCYLSTLWAPKLMYWLFAASQTAYINFLPVFYETTAHFSKMQIGVLQTLPTVCSMLAPPFWGFMADRLRSQRAVHNFCIASGCLLMFSAQFVRSFHGMLLIISLANFQLTPTGSLLDHAVLTFVERVGGEYGKQRMFASAGYGVFACVTSVCVQFFGLDVFFRLHLVLALLSIAALQFVPSPHVQQDYSAVGDDNSNSKTVSTLSVASAPTVDRIAKELCARHDVLLFLLVIFLVGILLGALQSFLTLSLFELSGNDPMIIGIVILCETTAELPAFFFAQKLLKRLGTVKMLLVTIAAYATRITWYYQLTNAWSAIPVEFLHGITFGFGWVTFTQFMYASAPQGLEGTMFGLMNACLRGLGAGFGTITGGFIYHHYGINRLWLLLDLVVVPLALVAVAAFVQLKKPINSVKQDEQEDQGNDDEQQRQQMADLFSPSAMRLNALRSSKRRQSSYEELE